MKSASEYIGLSILGCFCVLAIIGCEANYTEKDQGDHSAPVQEEGSSASDDPAATPGDTDPSSDQIIAGNPIDKGQEIYRSNWNGHDVRCRGADSTGGYFMSDVIDSTGALDLGSDGTATGNDFTSPKSGLHYHFQGFRESSVRNPLITENPHAVTPGSGTLRCYWEPVAEEATL